MMDAIRRQAGPAITRALGVDEAFQWEFRNAIEFRGKRDLSRDKLILHCDLTKRHSFAEGRTLSFLDQARMISVLTLWAPPGHCLARVRERQWRLLTNLPRRIAEPSS